MHASLILDAYCTSFDYTPCHLLRSVCVCMCVCVHAPEQHPVIDKLLLYSYCATAVP